MANEHFLGCARSVSITEQAPDLHFYDIANENISIMWCYFIGVCVCVFVVVRACQLW